MNSDEREEQLKQIRERLTAHRAEVDKYRGLKWADGDALRYYKAPDDIDFLLSLLDSQATGSIDTRVLAQAVWDKFWTDLSSDRWSVNDIESVLRAAGASGDAAVGAGLSSPCEADSISAAALAMRDKCVDRVREYLRHAKGIDIAPLIDDLQSLALDQVEEKQ